MSDKSARPGAGHGFRRSLLKAGSNRKSCNIKRVVPCVAAKATRCVVIYDVRTPRRLCTHSGSLF